LVDRIIDDIVRPFQARGFLWHGDYAGGDPREVAAYTIPLQQRVGDDWSTVELHLSKRARPWFSVYFAALPPTCRKLGEPIPRERANVVYAPAYFMLCKGETRGLDGQFGYHWFSLFPRSRIDAEVGKAVHLLPLVFDLFDRGIPVEWLTRDHGYVHKNVRLAGSWKIFEEMAARHRSGSAGSR
jgi:hypothetical protein